MTPFDAVKEFHEKFNVGINKPIDLKLANLRLKLIEEEYLEVDLELNSNYFDYMDMSKVDKKKLTKELADLLYVTIGTAVTFGLPLEEVFNEVHKSNMSKLGEDGKPVMRPDGKILKGPFYKEPNLDKFF